MPTKFVNILETSKLQIRGQSLDSASYVLLHFLTLRFHENLAPVDQFIFRIKTYLEKWVELADVEATFEGVKNLMIKEQVIDMYQRFKH